MHRLLASSTNVAPYAVTMIFAFRCRPIMYAGKSTLQNSLFPCPGGSVTISRLHVPAATRSSASHIFEWYGAQVSAYCGRQSIAKASIDLRPAAHAAP